MLKAFCLLKLFAIVSAQERAASLCNNVFNITSSSAGWWQGDIMLNTLASITSWSMIVTLSSPVTSFVVYNSASTTVDNKTFTLISYSWSGTLAAGALLDTQFQVYYPTGTISPDVISVNFIGKEMCSGASMNTSTTTLKPTTTTKSPSTSTMTTKPTTKGTTVTTKQTTKATTATTQVMTTRATSTSKTTVPTTTTAKPTTSTTKGTTTKLSTTVKPFSTVPTTTTMQSTKSSTTTKASTNGTTTVKPLTSTSATTTVKTLSTTPGKALYGKVFTIIWHWCSK